MTTAQLLLKAIRENKQRRLDAQPSKYCPADNVPCTRRCLFRPTCAAENAQVKAKAAA